MEFTSTQFEKLRIEAHKRLDEMFDKAFAEKSFDIDYFNVELSTAFEDYYERISFENKYEIEINKKYLKE